MQLNTFFAVLLVAILSISCNAQWLTDYQIINANERRPVGTFNSTHMLKGYAYNQDDADYGWAQWDLVTQSDGTYCIRVYSRYVSAYAKDDTALDAEATCCGTPQKFTITHEGDGLYSIKSYRNKYVYMTDSGTFKNVYQQDTLDTSAKWVFTKLVNSTPSFLQQSHALRRSLLSANDEQEPEIHHTDDEEEEEDEEQ
mmetsp:Transcript_9593/g.10554  ORF Transcript_9593/g.10554 Transcript_9593/m.10554 type:complete len:198 (-) Transcript_9593:202-795(-)